MAIKEYLRRVFPGTAEEFCQKAGEAMLGGKRLFVVTANPEILIHAEEDPSIQAMLLDEGTAVVPDGISVVKAMNLLGYPAKERITGVDLAEKLLRLAGEKGKRVYLLGAKEEVVSALAEKLVAQYPKMEVRYKNGYGKDKDADFREIEAMQPGGFGGARPGKTHCPAFGKLPEGRVYRCGRVFRRALRQQAPGAGPVCKDQHRVVVPHCAGTFPPGTVLPEQCEIPEGCPAGVKKGLTLFF